MNWKINSKLLAPKAHYMLYFGGVAAFWPYIQVFAKQMGISERFVGYIFTVAPILGIISMPLFGSIADRYKIKKKLFLVFNVVNLVAILCFAILTATETKTRRPVILDCGQGTSYISHCHHTKQDQWNSTAIQIKILDELSHKDYPIVCQLDCVASRKERNDFCTAVFNHDSPPLEMCVQNSSSMDMIPVSFGVTLDFKKVMPLEACMWIKIDSISENQDEVADIDRSISCYPEQKLEDCHINCPDLHSANVAMVEIESGETGNELSSRSFWLYATFTVIAWIAMAVVTSVADALCFQTLGDRHDLFGNHRKWGSIGWGLFTLFSGFLVDLVSGDSLIKNYTPCFWVAGILLTLNFYVCWKWDVEEEERPKAMGRRLVALMMDPKIFVFVMACVVVGMCTGLLWNFLFWYIEDLAKERMNITMETMRWMKLLQGLISIVQCFCGELPFFYLAGQFIHKIGHVNSMTIVIGTFGIRFLLYSILVNPWFVLPIELLQGFTYGIFYANMATYAYVVSPPGTGATVQGIVGSAFEGVGVSVGSLLGGLMIEKLKGRETFRIFGIFALVMCVLYKVIMMTIDRRFHPLSQTGNDLNLGTEMKLVDRNEKKPIDH